MLVRPDRVAWVSVISVWLVAAPAASHARPIQTLNLSTKALVATAVAYVSAYQRDFAYLVADEIYRQVNDPPAGAAPRQRVARGELFLTYLEADRMWTVVHDIGEVDGQPVPEHDSVRLLLQSASSSWRSIARRVLDENARYNIGGIARNFNDPMLALQVFSDRYQSGIKFDMARTTTRDGRTIATLTFRERERPTIVTGADGTPFYAQGEIDLDARSGEIEHTTFHIDQKGIGADLRTSFTREERLGLWVPATFTETYTARRNGAVEVTSCSSSYTNYRRFEVRGRVK